MLTPFTESVVEQAALAWLEALGYLVLSGPEIAPGEVAAEPLLQRTLECRRESRTLAALRDTLLSKLISGKLRLKIGGG